MLALQTRINVNTIKGMIKKIKGIDQVSGVRGLYKLATKPGVGAGSGFNFHNLLCLVPLPNRKYDYVLRTLSCDLTNFKFTIGNKRKQACLRISTNFPISVRALPMVFIIFALLVEKHTKEIIFIENVEVRNIEFNKDFRSLKLEGVNCITLENLIEQFKIYNKKHGVRLEHKLKVPTTANALIKLLGVEL